MQFDNNECPGCPPFKSRMLDHMNRALGRQMRELGSPLGTAVVLKYSSTWWLLLQSGLIVTRKSLLESHHHAIMSWTCQATYINPF